MSSLNAIGTINAMDTNRTINIMWFKRDLRLRDNQALQLALSSNKPLVLLYIVEPDQLNDPHMDLRHWRFISQSLLDLNEQLTHYGASIAILHGSPVDIFEQIGRTFKINHIFSHQEVGLKQTYDRDLAVSAWCKKQHVQWTETPQGAVYRPLNHRANWPKLWNGRILAAPFNSNLDNCVYINDIEKHLAADYQYELPQDWQVPSPHMQLGGEKRAWYTLKHFFDTRGKAYFGNIGDPSISRETCSRLSPYLAWGNISLKQVYQFSLSQTDRKGWARSITAFQSRLHWHCHFIQKFETESQMELRPVNKAYINYPYCTGQLEETRLLAWKNGCTGIPIIDACMKAVVQTGYLNFRMRAMVVSFLCHHLNVDWRRGASFLGAQFLDFEPGIHYPQFQMQAGVTGINTLRIYNPVKQSIEKDSEGAFIKKWLPQLDNLPSPLVHQPWSLTAMECAMYDFNCEKDYHPPIVDVEEAGREARDRMWSYRAKPEVAVEAKRIIAIHTT